MNAVSMEKNDKHGYVDNETVKLLVDAFYQKIRQHSELGAIFEDAIGLTDEEWQPHLKIMYKFWSTLMCKTGDFKGDHLQYKGTPMKKHQDLPTFDERLFDKWLELFHETAQEFHTEDIVAHYIDASSRVAQSLKLALYYKPEIKTHENAAQ